jgi:hypothetical protein
MNANELADFVEISKPDDKAHQEIATMLRQQQAEIEALKEIMVIAIKAGDWIVDGACDPDQYIGDRL